MFAGSRASLRLLRPHQRLFSATPAFFGKAIVYGEYGAPERVLELKETPTATPSASGVLVKMLAASINPADINMIQGNYGTSQILPAIPGNEGVGVVEQSNSSSFSKGDWVIPSQPGYGTWRTDFACEPSELIKIRNDIPVEYAAAISSNPCTAYRLLADFADLQKGDVVIQNASNSNVGQCVTQIAKAKGVHVINVIRSREPKALEALKQKMKAYGAENIITEEELVTPSFNSSFSSLPQPKLAINSVGGSSATNIAKRLGNVREKRPKGCLVTIGGMSKKPILLPTGAMIFKDLSFRGFWMTRWINNAAPEERKAMLDEIAALVKAKKLQLWFETASLDSFATAVKRSTEQQKDSKIIFKF